MALDKRYREINRKLDLLLEKAGIDPNEGATETPAPQPRELTAAEQQAIDNAPKPTPVAGPVGPMRMTVTNAPDTSSSVPSVPQGAVGDITIETRQPDGKTEVTTKPASEVKRK